MSKPRLRVFTRIYLAVAIFSFIVLAGLGYAADIGPIPATNWNPANLAKIKVSPAKPLTFAVFGDNRMNIRRFLRPCSRRLTGPPASPLPFIWATW